MGTVSQACLNIKPSLLLPWWLLSLVRLTLTPSARFWLVRPMEVCSLPPPTTAERRLLASPTPRLLRCPTPTPTATPMPTTARGRLRLSPSPGLLVRLLQELTSRRQSRMGEPNPVHAVAHTAAGLTHSSNVGICTNYVGAV